MLLLHAGRMLEPHDVWTAWTLDPLVVLSLALAGTLYVRGVRNVWNRAGVGRGVSKLQALSFAAGWMTLFIALVSPLHAIGEVLFSAHMTQHELLMVVAAPALVMGAPAVAFAWGLPAAWRTRVVQHRLSKRATRWWQVFAMPAVALGVHLAVLFVWHIPMLYESTLTSDAVHAAQHVSFLVSALAFWWGLWHLRGASRGLAVGYLFVAMMATGVLGALITFAPSLWYTAYAASTGPWGLMPLEDQRLGGAIMWIPGGASYLLAALWMSARLLAGTEAGTRVRASATTTRTLA